MFSFRAGIGTHGAAVTPSSPFCAMFLASLHPLSPPHPGNFEDASRVIPGGWSSLQEAQAPLNSPPAHTRALSQIAILGRKRTWSETISTSPLPSSLPPSLLSSDLTYGASTRDGSPGRGHPLSSVAPSAGVRVAEDRQKLEAPRAPSFHCFAPAFPDTSGKCGVAGGSGILSQWQVAMLKQRLQELRAAEAQGVMHGDALHSAELHRQAQVVLMQRQLQARHLKQQQLLLGLGLVSAPAGKCVGQGSSFISQLVLAKARQQFQAFRREPPSRIPPSANPSPNLAHSLRTLPCTPLSSQKQLLEASDSIFAALEAHRQATGVPDAEKHVLATDWFALSAEKELRKLRQIQNRMWDLECLQSGGCLAMPAEAANCSAESLHGGRAARRRKS